MQIVLLMRYCIGKYHCFGEQTLASMYENCVQIIVTRLSCAAKQRTEVRFRVKEPE